MKYEYIFIIIIIFFIIIKYYNTYENFTTTSAQDLIYSIYQNDVNIINNLSNLTEELQSSGIILLNDTNINKDLNILATYSPNILSFNNKWKLNHTSNPVLSSIPEMHDLVFIYNDNGTDNEVIRLNNTRQVIINNGLYCTLLQSDNILTFKGNINLVSSNDSNKIDINDNNIKIISGNNSIEINNTNIIFNGKTEFKNNIKFTDAICNANNSINSYILKSAARETGRGTHYRGELSSAEKWIEKGCGIYRDALQIYELVYIDGIINKLQMGIFNFSSIDNKLKITNSSSEIREKMFTKVYNAFGILTTHVFTNSTQTNYYIHQTYRIDNVILTRQFNNKSDSIAIQKWTINNP
jgi:hypothetical protein